MITTALTQKLGISHPVILGAMQGLSRAGLAAAVSNAGGLGVIAAGSFASADELREEISLMQSLTDRPFAVNFTLMPRRDEIPYEHFIHTALEAGVSIIETSGSSPLHLMEWLKSSGATLLHKTARLGDAQKMAQAGASAVTVFGVEAGGHVGAAGVSSESLILKAVNRLDVPVIAAGGFHDGPTLATALALGAEAVTMGTRFLACDECPLHPRLKESVLAAAKLGTVLIKRSTGIPARVLHTGFAEKILEMENHGAGAAELYEYTSSRRTEANYLKGDPEGGIIYCGEAAGSFDRVLSAREIIENTVTGAETILAKQGKTTS